MKTKLLYFSLWVCYIICGIMPMIFLAETYYIRGLKEQINTITNRPGGFSDFLASGGDFATATVCTVLSNFVCASIHASVAVREFTRGLNAGAEREKAKKHVEALLQESRIIRIWSGLIFCLAAVSAFHLHQAKQNKKFIHPGQLFKIIQNPGSRQRGFYLLIFAVL